MSVGCRNLDVDRQGHTRMADFQPYEDTRASFLNMVVGTTQSISMGNGEIF